MGVEAADGAGQRGQLRKEVARHLGDGQAHQVAQLRQRDQHRDAIGEADHDAHRDVADQHPQLEQAQHEHQHAGHHGGHQQVGEAVAVDDAVDDDDEGASRAADLHLRAAQRADQETRDHGGDQPLFGLDTRSDAKGQGQRQGHDAHRDASAQIGEEALAVIALQRVKQSRTEGVEAIGQHGVSGVGSVAGRDTQVEGHHVAGAP
jgi:hypothetical protein